jgi:hypothetical protein
MVTRDLDYGDVTADADRMQAVLDMRAMGHSEKCINDGRPADEPTRGCKACATARLNDALLSAHADAHELIEGARAAR